MSDDLDRLIAAGSVALARSLDAQPMDGVTDDLVLRFWDLEVEAAHDQHFRRGRLVSWRRDIVTVGPAVEIVCPARRLGALLGMAGDRPTLFDLRLRHGGTGTVAPPPPFDPATTAGLALTPEVAGASCVAALHFPDSPFDASHVTVTIADGRPTFSIGVPWQPDVEADLRFDLTLRYVAGDLGLMDMLTGGSITGDWPQLMLLAGVLDSPEVQSALEPVRTVLRHLADTARVLSAPGYRSAMADVSPDR